MHSQLLGGRFYQDRNRKKEDHTPSALDFLVANLLPTMEQQAVRFASRDDEIAPEQTLQPMADIMGKDESETSRALNADAEEELQQLKTTLRNNIQSSRMQHHAFEPVSLPGSQPASRVSLRCLHFATFR